MDILVTDVAQVSWIGPGGQQIHAPCALGRGGVAYKSGEGDGITPLGRFPLRRVFYRADRLSKPTTGLALVALEKHHGWCDDPADAAYNTLVTRPYPARHETLWRDDALYDVIVETGYNDDPVIAGKGSAIFMHIAKPNYDPTEGCVALKKADLLRLLADCNGGDFLVISAL